MQKIRPDTFAKLLERGYGLSCWCPGCKRWASCDVRMLCRIGMGDRPILGARAQRRVCGSEGTWQVRAPTPQFGRFNQYGKQ